MPVNNPFALSFDGNIAQWNSVNLGNPTAWGTPATGQVVIGVNAELFAGNTLLTATGSSLNVNVTGGAASGTQYLDGTAESVGAFTGTVAMGYNGTNVVGLRLDPSNNLLVNVSGTVTTVGNLTHNSAAPSTNNVGVLPAVASTAAPTYTAGDQVLLSTDLAGNLRVAGSLVISGSDTVGTTVALNAVNTFAFVPVTGQGGAGLFLAAGTLSATLTPESSFDGGTTWTGAFFFDPVNSALTTNTTVNNPNGAIGKTIIFNAGASHVRVRVSVFTSGTANATCRATMAAGGNYVNIATALPGITSVSASGNINSGVTDSGGPVKVGYKFNTTQPTVTNGQRVDAQGTSRGGLIVATGVDPFLSQIWDGTNTAAVKAASTSPLATDPALVVTISPNSAAITADSAGTGTSNTAAATWNSATASNTAVAIINTNFSYNTAVITFNQTTTLSGGAATFEVSNDGTNWLPISGNPQNGGNIVSSYSFNPSTYIAFTFNISGWQNFRVRLSPVITGTGSVTVGYALQTTGQPILLSADVKDTGRTYVTFYIDSATGITIEALETMAINRGGSASSATSYTVTGGKTLRIQSYTVSVQGNNSTVQTSKTRLRSGVTVGISSPVLHGTFVSTSGVTNNVSGLSTTFPDGLEIAGGQQIGISHLDSSATSDVTVSVVGYEY